LGIPDSAYYSRRQRDQILASFYRYRERLFGRHDASRDREASALRRRFLKSVNESESGEADIAFGKDAMRFVREYIDSTNDATLVNEQVREVRNAGIAAYLRGFSRMQGVAPDQLGQSVQARTQQRPQGPSRLPQPAVLPQLPSPQQLPGSGTAQPAQPLPPSAPEPTGVPVGAAGERQFMDEQGNVWRVLPGDSQPRMIRRGQVQP
jgi:hypothetical protein